MLRVTIRRCCFVADGQLKQGPLVGTKNSSQVITEEYAKADPIYIAKTAVSVLAAINSYPADLLQALPQKYSHYRPILGDGNCGWRGKLPHRDTCLLLFFCSDTLLRLWLCGSRLRENANWITALGFSYFETLLRLRNISQLEAEIARITSLNNLLETAGGFQSWLFEDMVEETTTLLKDLASSLQNPKVAAELLLQRFNNPEVSNAIVYHFRLLASSWIKSSPAAYQDFIPGEIQNDVVGYCKDWLEAPNMEIDHLGMALLIDVLMKPIGFAVEIIYLDRSSGSEVNSHVHQPVNSNGAPTIQNPPMVYLLYKPGHYDILYNDRNPSISLQHPIEDAIQNIDIQVNRATNFSQHHAVQTTPAQMHTFSNLDMTSLLSIPGFQCQPQQSHHGFPSQFSPIEQRYTTSPMSASPVSPGPSPLNSNSSASVLSLSATFPPQPPSALAASPALNTTQHSVHPTFPATTQLPIHLPQPSRTRADISPPSASSSFRPSKYEWEAAADWQEPVSFQTSTFKNSHYNTAHYNNPNFQPEEWSPDCEEAGGGGGGGGRKRST